MYIFDITNMEQAIKSITTLTHIKAKDIKAFIQNHIIKSDIVRDGTSLTGANFIDEFSIEPEDARTDEILICALHYTSNDDDCESIKAIGLRDLQYALTGETTLSRFLAKHEIVFDVAHCTMRIGSKQFDISYTRGGYDRKNPVTGIARKVFYDNGLSCFLHVEDITDYLGEVHIRPEILDNLDQLYPRLMLSQRWAQQCKRYEVKFASPIDMFERYSFRDDDGSLYEALLDKALCVAGRICSSEVCAYMKPKSIIERNQILSIIELQ